MNLPRFVQIEPVGHCNLKCRMCPIQFRRDGPPGEAPAFMAYDTFVTLLDQFGSLNELHLQGLGEPFLHPRFFDMVTYATRKGIRVSTNSNGTLLRPAAAEGCILSGLDSLHISIDGATALTYEGIRQGANFAKVIRNLKLMTETRARFASRSPHIRVVMVVMRRNLAELPEVVRLAHHCGADALFVQHLSHDFAESTLPPYYRSMRDFVEAETLLGEAPERVWSSFNMAKETAAAVRLPLRLPNIEAKLHPPGTPGPVRCDWPWRGAYVSYQGLAMPCCMLPTPDRGQLGDMVKDGAASVWNGAAYEAFRRQLDSDTPPEVCRSCAVYRGTF
jgi:MoaA/NifB/PqqE/SkfB family radical SAM enzyme